MTDKYAALLARPKAEEIAHTPETIRTLFLESKRNPNTARAYTRGLDQFGAFFAHYGIPLFEVDKAALEVYLTSLLDEGASAQKVNQVFSAIKGFYDLAIEHNKSTGVFNNPTAKITLPKLPKVSASRGMTVDQIMRLRRAARSYQRKDWLKGERDSVKAVAVIELLLTTGLRVAEACKANVGDFDTSGDWPTLDVVRKGGERDRVTMPWATGEALSDLLDGREDGPLILSATGRRETENGIARLLLAVGVSGGLDFLDRLHPHNLRHAYATLSYAAEKDLLATAAGMGHASPQTTIRYVHRRTRVSPEQARRILGLDETE